MIMKNLTRFVIVVLLFNAIVRAEDDPEDPQALKCIVKYLTERGVQEEFFASVDTSTVGSLECDRLRQKKLDKGFGKIEDKLLNDNYFKKHASCIMNGLKTEENKNIVLQREAIKIHGLGIKVWNYFDQKQHLDDLKKKLEKSLNKVAQDKCI